MVAAIRQGTMAQKLLKLVEEHTMKVDSQSVNPKNESADIAGVQAVI
jgi:hypothetical protein